jgi:hypothetical protein
MLFLGLKQRLMGFPARIKSELDAIHGISVDETLLVEMVEDALKGLSEHIASHSKHLGEDRQRDGTSEADDNNRLGGGLSGDESEVNGSAR